MQRWKLTLEYDGSDFVGWQRQQDGVSVQGVIEQAIAQFTQETVTAHVAGRTDAGVHACGQVMHVDIQKEIDEKAMRDATNVFCRPYPVAVIHAEKVPHTFHARFDAKKRYYRFVILNRRTPPVLEKNRVWHVSPPLDCNAMQLAANHLLGGPHDFSSFRAAVCQAKHAIRSIDAITITQDGEMIYTDLEAKSFLHHQVRNIMGTLKKIGEGYWHPDDMKRILAARNRMVAGPTAPPSGLYFMKVEY